MSCSQKANHRNCLMKKSLCTKWMEKSVSKKVGHQTTTPSTADVTAHWVISSKLNSTRTNIEVWLVDCMTDIEVICWMKHCVLPVKGLSILNLSIKFGQWICKILLSGQRSLVNTRDYRLDVILFKVGPNHWFMLWCISILTEFLIYTTYLIFKLEPERVFF